MNLKKIISLILVSALIFPVSGCSAFRSNMQSFTVTTDQNDAEIYVNGSLAGKGAVTTQVKRDENVQVMAKKEGYVPIQRTIGTHMNSTSILDIIGGIIFIIPIFGLLAGGSKSLDQNNISITMVKE